jgi:hypothetical protein
MNGLDLAALATTLGIGGAVGAVAALVVAGRNVFEAFDRFKAAFHTQLDGKSDASSVALRNSFSELEADIGSLNGAFSKVGRAFRRTK